LIKKNVIKISLFLRKRSVTQFGFKERNGSSLSVTPNGFLHTTENFLGRRLMKLS
jgi:hypothetical protein